MYKASKGNREHVFSQVPEAQIPRSVFNRSHSYKTTMTSDYLVPFYVDEALPGDTFNLKSTLFARMATPVAPIMDNLYLDTFYFAVPLRLVWDNFKKFMGEQTDPGDSTSYTVPQIVSPSPNGWPAESLSDYFGLPINLKGLSVSAFWHRAYNLIYNEWFRDQNLIDSVVVDKDDSASDDTDYVLLKRAKKHDYFTSALLYPQKGDDAVTIPLGATAPVVSDGANAIHFVGMTSAAVVYPRLITGPANIDYGVVSGTVTNQEGVTVRSTGVGSGMVTDLENATAASINSLRQAFQLQKLLERDARGGTRYTEIVKAHFGVTSPDARMQRPEYLGGGSTPVIITPVPQMSSTTGSYAQGRMAGFGTAVERGSGFTKSFTEHCVLIGLMNVRADLTYQQGINKMFLRETKYDFYWPALAHIGEQAVVFAEIYAQAVTTPGDAADLENQGVFGYQERYAEYRYKPSLITGKLRSTYSTPLDVWHLAQEFGSKPILDQTFIESAVPMARVSAVETEPHFVVDSWIDCRCARPMPVYSVPGLIDHF